MVPCLCEPNTLDQRRSLGLYNGGLKEDDDESKLLPADARQPSRAGNTLQQGNTAMMQPGLSSQLFNYVVQESVARATKPKADISNESTSSASQPPVVLAENRRHTRAASRASLLTPLPPRLSASLSAKINDICDKTDYSCWQELQEHVQKQLRDSFFLSDADAGVVRIAEIHILRQTTADDDYPVPQLKPGTFAKWVHPPTGHKK
jgi:hypothetical protein